MRRAIFGWALAVSCVAVAASVGADTTTWRPLEINGFQVQWERPADSRAPLVLTWRIAGGEQAFPDAQNCRQITAPGRLLAASKIDRALFQNELSAAFAMWQRVANIVFVEAEPGRRPDITIGAQAEPTGRAFTDVAFAEFGSGSRRSIHRSVICLNPEHNWKIGFDGNLDVYDLRFTLAHEIGHAIGLDHPDGRGALMWFSYDEKSPDLQRGDIQGAIALYGPSQLDGPSHLPVQ